MPQSAQITAAVQRCNEAWQKVRSQLPPDAGRHAQADNNELCRWAFLDQLPILCNPESFQTWIACIAQGVVLGVIDLADAGRYCHLAHSAIAAWRLANPPQKKEKHTPLPPPNGNHVEGENHPSAPEPGAPGPSHLGTRERCRDDANHPSAKPEGTPPPSPPFINPTEEDESPKSAGPFLDRDTQDKLYQLLKQAGVPSPGMWMMRLHARDALRSLHSAGSQPREAGK